MNVFMEAAKLRAARRMWACIMDGFGAKNARSKMLRTHCQTSGVSLTEQQPLNNVVRTTLEAMAAVMGGTQSLHTNSFDEAIALPTEVSARVARNTQLILQHEAGMTDVVDPLGGSYYVEALTDELEATAQKLIDEVEALGGMTKAVADGLPKRRIEEAAARRQARIDRSQDVIVGINRYRLDEEDPLETLKIDTDEVRRGQVASIRKVRDTRDEEACRDALDALTRIAQTGKGNLLASAIECARARATLGEISDAMEKAFGRYDATPDVITGVYADEYGTDPEYDTLRARIAERADAEGAPSLLVAKMGQDGHDRGAKVIATAFGDLGYTVHVSDLFETPEEAADRAIREDVDVVGVSSLAAGHLTLVPQLIRALRERGREDIIVVCGGVIPPDDYGALREAGVAEVFGPGTNVLEAARAVLDRIEGLRRNR